MPPPQALGLQQLVDAAALDRDALLFVEVGLQPVERPAAEGQAQVLRGGQGRGEDRGPLVGVVGGRAARAGSVLQGGGPAVVEPADPGRDGRPGEVESAGDLTDRLAVGGGQDEAGPLDGPGRGDPGMGELFQFSPLVGGEFTKPDSGWHGGPPYGWYPDQLANHLPDEPLSRSTKVF
jgi:hypothetical protein